MFAMKQLRVVTYYATLVIKIMICIKLMFSNISNFYSVLVRSLVGFLAILVVFISLIFIKRTPLS